MHETILETEQRLSNSILWNLQLEAYTQFGIEAWSHRGVPSYITSNSFTARSYAQVVLGYLRDNLSSFDPNHPIYIFDLGAGTGRFAYLFLKELMRCLPGLLPKIKICYVMTDVAEANIKFWQRHPYLQPYFESGILDCAFYSHSQRDPIRLIVQNETLLPEAIINPLIIIANYFFDTIPQDLFRVKNGILEEGRVTIAVSTDDKVADYKDPGLINRLNFSYAYHPIADAKAYYPDSELNHLLEKYRQEFNGISFLFPIGAFQTLNSFIRWSGSRLMLLAGDQGYCTKEQVRQNGEPRVALHGSFSMPVSYHAIAAFFQQLNGASCLTSFSDPAFVAMAGMLDAKHHMSFPEAKQAFSVFIDSFEPTDYWRFVSLTEDQWKKPPLDQLLLLIKLGNWDAMSLHAFFPIIRSQLSTATDNQKLRLAETIDRVWDYFYPVTSQEGGFVSNLGILLYEMKFYAKALTYFERAMHLSGSNSEILKNAALCRNMLGDG